MGATGLPPDTMLRFFLQEVGSGRPYAEFHIVDSGKDAKVIAMPSTAFNGDVLRFSRESRKRHFEAWLTGNSERDFKDTVYRINLFGPQGIQGRAVLPDPPSPKTGEIQWKFRFSNSDGGWSDDFRIRPSIWGYTNIYIQWDYKDCPVEATIPVDVAFSYEVQQEYGLKYERMKTSLETEGWFSFIYDNLRGTFAQNRISIDFKMGGSVLDCIDSETERNAIRTEWNWFFDKAIPAVLRCPQYCVGEEKMFIPLAKIRKPSPDILRQLRSRIDVLHVSATSRVMAYDVPAHDAIASFLIRIKRRFEFLVSELQKDFDGIAKRLEWEQNRSKPVPGVIQTLKSEQIGLRNNVNRERVFEGKMTSDMLWLQNTRVFRKSLSQGNAHKLSFDFPSACFSSSRVYSEIWERMVSFDETYWSWLSPSRFGLEKRPEPVEIKNCPDRQSTYQFAYSILYQHWCYLQFCLAMKKAGLKDVGRNLHSGRESWVRFSDSNGLVVTLFHEVLGEGKSTVKSMPRPFSRNVWGSEWKTDHYNTPDFVFLFSDENKVPFLVVVDAKSSPNWSDKEHGEVWNKYKPFRMYPKGFVDNTGRFVKTLQTWVVYPGDDLSGSIFVDDANDRWAVKAGTIICSVEWQHGNDWESHDVCNGRISGRPPSTDSEIALAGEPFRVFVQAQLDYFRNQHPTR